MFNNRKFNNRIRMQRIDACRPLWIDLAILLITAVLCTGAGWAGLALLESIK